MSKGHIIYRLAREMIDNMLKYPCYPYKEAVTTVECVFFSKWTIIYVYVDPRGKMDTNSFYL